MGLSQALASAMSGLRANQIALGLVSSNVANAETPGYIKKTSNQIAVSSGEFGSSVRVAGINRELDVYLQRQLRTEMSGAAYAGVRAEVLDQLQSIYGTPGSAGTLESVFNSLTTAVQSLSTSSDSQSARIAVVNAAQSLVQQLNTMTRGIQSLRANAESGLSGAVNIANNAMSQIANINVQVLRGGQTDGAAAELLDQRDRYLNQLSELMDIRVVTNEDGQVNVFTTSGVQLVGAEASQLTFRAAGHRHAQHALEPERSRKQSRFDHRQLPARRQHGSVRREHVPLRHDRGSMSNCATTRWCRRRRSSTSSPRRCRAALSDRTVAGTPATSGAQTGFRSRSLRSAERQRRQPDLYELDHRRAAARCRSFASTMPSLLPLPNNRDQRSERPGHRRRFLRRHGVGGLAVEYGAGRRQSRVLERRNRR